MARRHTRGFVRPAPRTKMWIGAGVGRTVIVASAKSLISTLSAGALLLRPFTILRTRQLVSWFTDQEAADEGPFGAYGKIVVTEQASSVGVTAVPSPGTIAGTPEADWFVHQNVWTQFVVIGAISASVVSSPNSYEVDSKAMRKVGPEDDVVSMFQEEAGVGGFLTTQGRMLIQLH